MLTLTDNAKNVIHDLTHLPEVPDGSGLRIAPSQQREGLEVSLVPTPEPGDDVIDTGDAKVFLEPQTSQLLSEQVLDAQGGDSSASFVLTSKDGEPA